MSPFPRPATGPNAPRSTGGPAGGPPRPAVGSDTPSGASDVDRCDVRQLHAVIDQRVITIIEAYDVVKIRDGHVDRDSLLAELRSFDDPVT